MNREREHNIALLNRKNQLNDIEPFCLMILNKVKDEIKDLEYDDDTHSYFINSQRLFSVTTIMGQLNPYKFTDIPLTVLLNKARIGSMTHYLGEQLFYDRSITLEQYLDCVDPLNLWGDEYRTEVTNYWTAMINYWKFLETQDDCIMFASELKVFDKDERLAGTIDNLKVELVNKLNENGEVDVNYNFIISDYKTSAVIDVFSQGLQLYAYAYILNKIIGFEVFTTGILVQLKRDGTYKEYRFNLKEYEKRWNILKQNFDVNILPLIEKN